MRINAYSLYDRKTLVYHNPFFALTDSAASRIVADIVADPNTSVGRHPNDYVLFRIGTYDDGLGLMLPETPIQHVVDANGLVAVRGNGDLFADLNQTTAEVVASLNGAASPSK